MRRERVGGRAPEGSGSGFRPGLEHLTDAHRQPPPAPEPSGEFKPRERGPGATEKVGEEAGKGSEECGAVERDRCWLQYGTGLGRQSIRWKATPAPHTPPQVGRENGHPQMPVHPESEKQVREEWELGLSGSHCDEVVEDLD